MSPEVPRGCRLHLTRGDEGVSVALPGTVFEEGVQPAAAFKKKTRELIVQIPWVRR